MHSIACISLCCSGLVDGTWNNVCVFLKVRKARAYKTLCLCVCASWRIYTTLLLLLVLNKTENEEEGRSIIAVQDKHLEREATTNYITHITVPRQRPVLNGLEELSNKPPSISPSQQLVGCLEHWINYLVSPPQSVKVLLWPSSSSSCQ